MKSKSKHIAGSLVALFSLSPVASQAATAPDAGTLLQQTAPATQPPAPSGNGINVEQQGEAKPSPGISFEVRSIAIFGNSLFDAGTLHALVAEGEGKVLTLPQLQALAARLTDFYRQQGYPLARAIIPAQTVKDGVVTFQIIEARYGKVLLDNHSAVNDSLLQSTLAPLSSGSNVGRSEMDRALLLLSDIPGVELKATLRPGAEAGTSDLDVQTSALPAITGNLTADNYGNFYTGRARLSGSVNYFNPLHHGDLLSLNFTTSERDMSLGRVGYDSLLNGTGTRVGGAYSAMRYELGRSLASLGAHGTAQVGSVWAKQPLVRGRDLNLFAQVEYDQTVLNDRIDTGAIKSNRRVGDNIVTLHGDVRDGLFGGGVNTWSLGLTLGQLDFENNDAQASDQAAGRTAGHFRKWNLSASRLQTLAPADTLYLAASGQWTDTNLDSVEKLTVGGPFSVRAYDVGALSGDSGYTATVELRHAMGRNAWGEWLALAFVDYAQLTVNNRPWVAGENSAALTGGGLGLAWSGPDLWRARASVAARIGDKPVLVQDGSSARGWIEISRAF